MSKPGLNMERHREIGLELAVIQDRLTSLAVEAGNAYPLTGPKSALYRHLHNVGDRLTRARSAAEEAMFAEHGDAGDVTVYYPTREARAGIHEVLQLEEEAIRDAREVIAEYAADHREYQVSPQ